LVAIKNKSKSYTYVVITNRRKIFKILANLC